MLDDLVNCMMWSIDHRFLLVRCEHLYELTYQLTLGYQVLSLFQFGDSFDMIKK